MSTQRLVPPHSEQPAALPQGRRSAGAQVVADARPLARRGVGQILDTSMDVLVSHFGALVGIAALCWLPLKVGGELLWLSGAGATAHLLWSLTTVAPQLLTTSFVCGLVGAHLMQREASLGQALRVGFLRFPGMLVIAVLNVAASVVLLCPCGITTYAAYWLFAVIPAVYVLERERLAPLNWFAQIWAAVVRGFKLVWGWGAFGRWLGWSSVAFFAIGIPLGMIPGAVEMPQVREFLEQRLGAQGSSVEFLIATVGSAFVGIATAYMAVLMTVYYTDQRVRREGLDLELRLGRLAARVEGVEPMEASS